MRQRCVPGQAMVAHSGNMDAPRPRVGIGVMVMREGKILLGKRLGSHGAEEYAWPGGHLEHMESFAACARREVREEAGIEIANIQFVRLMNLTAYPPKHYVDIGLRADWASGEPTVLEPEKCAGWEWYDLDHLPSPLLATEPSYLEALRTGRTYFDA
ncbi:NUDIX domain-containing protein [Candidatus Uhrbacteria bacterium]|nr:NUDIX domain-containing protein [Candidatus Uhrbacteria bacterium]